jgi:hypothetical protein
MDRDGTGRRPSAVLPVRNSEEVSNQPVVKFSQYTAQHHNMKHATHYRKT